MHDRANGLLRITIPRTPVNRNISQWYSDVVICQPNALQQDTFTNGFHSIYEAFCGFIVVLVQRP
jgi:hypothetical protein